MNSQRTYGGDVISRIDYANKSEENLLKLQKLVYEDIMNLIFELTENINDIKVLSISGNTTMMHLLLGINPIEIAKAPFIPTTLKGRICYLSQIYNDNNLENNFDPVCILLPSIAGYVGADITAGILSCNMDKNDKTSILIDIGTNGEIALSSKNGITACSTAAGPAFEGANITCGIGGVAGAIDKVFINDNNLSFTTIANERTIGICGSGIVASIAVLLDLGVIDETGRFEDDIEKFSIDTQDRIIDIGSDKAFVFAYTDNNKPVVYITQKDIREVQNAKAAVCAGISLLIQRESLSYSDIDEVYIAGGFGNFLNIEDAFKIGLIPTGLKGKTKMIGNTSIIGASLCLLDIDQLERCEKIRKKTHYYELSSDKKFTDLYIDAMLFE